jgi:hypothetical protein
MRLGWWCSTVPSITSFSPKGQAESKGESVFHKLWPVVYRRGTTVVRTILARPLLGAEKSVWFAQTVKFGFLLINPFFAQLYSMLLGLLFSFAQLALDSLNLNDRSEPAPLINNTN